MLRKESFLSRWSRLKKETESLVKTEPGKPLTDEPKLPLVEQLNMESDYTAFFHPKVEEKLRREALRKLFKDPHFNVMDGLDVYIDDYGKPDPIPPEMLARLLESNPLLFPPTKEQPADESQGQKSQESLPQQQPQPALESKQEKTEPNTQSNAKPGQNVAKKNSFTEDVKKRNSRPERDLYCKK
jgi:hypothetical protein